MSDILHLRELIPICAVCKKLSVDRSSWMQVEAYFEEQWGIAFSHGLCPECLAMEKQKVTSLMGLDAP